MYICILLSDSSYEISAASFAASQLNSNEAARCSKCVAINQASKLTLMLPPREAAKATRCHDATMPRCHVCHNAALRIEFNSMASSSSSWLWALCIDHAWNF